MFPIAGPFATGGQVAVQHHTLDSAAILAVVGKMQPAQEFAGRPINNF
jgi:hypothetical protein